MKTPAKIVVVAEFAPNRPPEGVVSAQGRSVAPLMTLLQPRLVLDKPEVELDFTGLDSFAPEALISAFTWLGDDHDALTAVLHHPRFQALESAWRGLAYMLADLPETGVEVQLLNSPPDEVRQRFYDHVFKPEFEGLTDRPLTMTLLDFDHDHGAASLQVFKDMARMAESLQAPVVAQTGASLFGVKNLIHVPAIQNPFDRFKDPAHTEWNAFRGTDTAFWSSLMINRFLLRPLHATDSYVEPASADKPERYLWGRAIWVLGANAIRSITNKGHLATVSGLGTGGERGGQILRELPVTRTDKIKTPLEVSFPQDVVEALPYFGVSPITQLPADMGGQNQPDVLYLHLAANMHLIPDPEGERYALLTVPATLSYSLVLGRLSNLALRCQPDLAGLDPPDAAAFLSKALLEELAAEDEQLEVAPADDHLHVVYRPGYAIHSKAFEIDIDLPLRAG